MNLTLGVAAHVDAVSYTHLDVYKRQDYYNNSRIQAKTKWMPPSKFREASMMES